MNYTLIFILFCTALQDRWMDFSSGLIAKSTKLWPLENKNFWLKYNFKNHGIQVKRSISFTLSTAISENHMLCKKIFWITSDVWSFGTISALEFILIAHISWRESSWKTWQFEHSSDMCPLKTVLVLVIFSATVIGNYIYVDWGGNELEMKRCFEVILRNSTILSLNRLFLWLFLRLQWHRSWSSKMERLTRVAREINKWNETNCNVQPKQDLQYLSELIILTW